MNQQANLISVQEARDELLSGWYTDIADHAVVRLWDGGRWSRGISRSETPSQPKSGKAGWCEDPTNVDRLRWWDGRRWCNATISKKELFASDAQYIAMDGDWHPMHAEVSNGAAPTVARWKTSIGFSVLGVVASFLLGTALVVLAAFIIWSCMGEASREINSTVVSGAAAGIVLSILAIVYAGVFYPSYFTDKPKLKSCKLVSFLNLMFGGVIFGCLWNGNLTRSRSMCRLHKGTSYIVSIVLSVLVVISNAYNVAVGSNPVVGDGSRSASSHRTYEQQKWDALRQKVESVATVESDNPNHQIMPEIAGTPDGCVPWTQAPQHLGETVTIYGRVLEAGRTSSSEDSPAYLYVASANSDTDGFTVMIQNSDRAAFPEPPEEMYDQQLVCVTGEVLVSNGLYGTVIAAPSQIEIV